MVYRVILVFSVCFVRAQLIDNFFSSIINFSNKTLTDIASKNETLLRLAEKLSPDVNKTVGLNSISKSLQKVLPSQTRNQIAAMAANEEQFNAMWNHLNTSWTNFIERSESLRKQFEESGLLDRARNSTKAYNDLMRWRASLPFTKFDVKLQALRDLTNPLYNLRTEFIKSRDEVLQERLNVQAALQSPIRAIGLKIGETTTEISDKIKDVEWNLLRPLTENLNETRIILNESGDDYRVIRAYIKVCALNPACCENPQNCIDQVEI